MSIDESQPPLRIREADGDPNAVPVFEIVVTNGTLTKLGPGRVGLATGGGGASSVAYAPSGAYYIVDSLNATLPNALKLTSGSSTTVRTDGSAIYVDAITGGAGTIVYAPTGAFYIVQSINATLTNEFILAAGSSTTVRTDGQTVYIDATTNSATTNVGTGGFIQFPVQSAKLYSNTSSARIDAGTPVWRLLYSALTQQYGMWQFNLPFDYSGAPAMQLTFSSDSSLSVARSISWIVDQWGYGNSQSSIYIDSFAGANSTNIALSAGYSAGLVHILTVPLAITNSFAAGNLIKLRVSSSAGAVTGNQELIGLGLFYRAGTQTIATGSAGLMGTASVVSNYVDVTASRAFNTTYTNSGSGVKSVMAMVCGRCVITLAAGSSFLQAFADAGGTPSTVASGVVGIESGLLNEDNTYQLCFVATNGLNYRVNATTANGTLTLERWFEFNI